VLTRRRSGRTVGCVGNRVEPIERVEIELVAVDDGTSRAACDPDHPSLADQMRHGYDLVRERAGDVHAAPGYRPGAVPQATSTRRGGDCDVVRSMRVDPWTATTIAGSRSFRHDEHRYLTFVESGPSDDRMLTWKVVLASPRLRAVPATLHLRAAPSMVLSVLELVPRRRLRWRQAAFVQAGVEAVESLAHEFEHDVRVVSNAT
jgi:hypothetical protein